MKNSVAFRPNITLLNAAKKTHFFPFVLSLKKTVSKTLSRIFCGDFLGSRMKENISAHARSDVFKGAHPSLVPVLEPYSIL